LRPSCAPPAQTLAQTSRDDAPLLFRVGGALEGRQELLARIHVAKVKTEGAESLHDFDGLVLAHQARVDEHRREVFPIAFAPIAAATVESTPPEAR